MATQHAFIVRPDRLSAVVPYRNGSCTSMQARICTLHLVGTVATQTTRTQSHRSGKRQSMLHSTSNVVYTCAFTLCMCVCTCMCFHSCDILYHMSVMSLLLSRGCMMRVLSICNNIVDYTDQQVDYTVISCIVAAFRSQASIIVQAIGAILQHFGSTDCASVLYFRE